MEFRKQKIHSNLKKAAFRRRCPLSSCSMVLASSSFRWGWSSKYRQLREEHCSLLPNLGTFAVPAQAEERLLPAQPADLLEVSIGGAEDQEQLRNGGRGALCKHHTLPRGAEHSRQCHLIVVHLNNVFRTVLHEVASTLVVDREACAEISSKPTTH